MREWEEWKSWDGILMSNLYEVDNYVKLHEFMEIQFINSHVNTIRDFVNWWGLYILKN